MLIDIHSGPGIVVEVRPNVILSDVVRRKHGDAATTELGQIRLAAKIASADPRCRGVEGSAYEGEMRRSRDDDDHRMVYTIMSS